MTKLQSKTKQPNQLAARTLIVGRHIANVV